VFFVFKHPRKPKTTIVIEIALSPVRWRPIKEYVGDFYRWLWLWFSFTIVPGWDSTDFSENVKRVSRKASLLGE